MSLAHGFNCWLGYAKESTYGTAVVAAKFLEIESESIKCERRYNVVPLLGHVSQRRVVAGKTNVSGSFRAPVLVEGCEQILEAAIGSAGTTGPSGGLYTHTFSLAAALPTGLTLEVNRDDAAITGDAAYQYPGCKISKFTLIQEMEQPLMMEVEIIGRNRTLIAATAKTFPTYNAWDYGHMTLTQVDAGGTPYELKTKSLKIMIDNGLFDDQYRLGSQLRAGLTRGSQRKVSVEAEIEYESLDVFNRYLNMTLDDLRFKWVSGSNSLQIDLPRVTFDGEDPGTESHGPYYLNMTNTALANAADNDELTAVLINTTVSV